MLGGNICILGKWMSNDRSSCRMITVRLDVLTVVSFVFHVLSRWVLLVDRWRCCWWEFPDSARWCWDYALRWYVSMINARFHRLFVCFHVFSRALLAVVLAGAGLALVIGVGVLSLGGATYKAGVGSHFVGTSVTLFFWYSNSCISVCGSGPLYHHRAKWWLRHVAHRLFSQALELWCT